MASPGRLAQPPADAFPSRAAAQLNALLHHVHLRAGRPSSRQMVILIKRQGAMSPPPSHSTVYDAFATVRLPSQQLVVALLDVLTEVGLMRNSADRESLKQGAADSWLRAAAAENGAADALEESLPAFPTFLSPSSPLRELSLVTPEEAGHVLRLPAAEVQRLMDSHELETVQVSPRRQRVLVEALQAYLDRIAEGGLAS